MNLTPKYGVSSSYTSTFACCTKTTTTTFLSLSATRANVVWNFNTHVPPHTQKHTHQYLQENLIFIKRPHNGTFPRLSSTEPCQQHPSVCAHESSKVSAWYWQSACMILRSNIASWAQDATEICTTRDHPLRNSRHPAYCILPILVRKLAVGVIPATAILNRLLRCHGIFLSLRYSAA